MLGESRTASCKHEHLLKPAQKARMPSMTEAEFWHLVDSTRTTGDRDLQVAKLGEALLHLSAVEYSDLLRRFFGAKHEITRRDDLLNAAYLANEQCLSLDVLDYFCYWLIGSGSAAYQQALKNPDAVVELMHSHGHPSFEEFAGALFDRPEAASLGGVAERIVIKGRIWSADEQRRKLPLLYQYSLV
ncbi:MAG: DUF4240 domain-containing protein [Prosthecobacter sp.]